MTLVTVVACCAAGGYAAMRLARAWRPRSAFTEFRWRYLRAFFGVVVTVLSRRRWLIVVPLAVAVLTCLLVDLPWLWYWWFGQPSEVLSARPIPYDPGPVGPRVYVRAALNASFWLSNGYLGTAVLSIPLIVVCLAGFLLGLRKLKRRTAEAMRGRLTLAARATWATLLLVAALGTVRLLEPRDVGTSAGELPFGFFAKIVILDLAAAVASLTILVPWALAEGCVLLYLKAALTGEKARFEDVWNGSLAVLGPLAALHVLWFVVIALPWRVAGWFGVFSTASQDWLRSVSLAFNELASWWRYAGAIVATVFCCASFIVVVSGERPVRALMANLRFVRDHFALWLALVGICLLVLWMAGVVGGLLGHYVPWFSWWHPPVTLLARAVRICAVAFCSIALFGFFVKYASVQAAPS